MGADSETLKIYTCKNGHRWEAEDPAEGCPECGKPGMMVKEVSERKTEEGEIESGESGFANDPDPYGKAD